jgi:solute carrier family 25 protein 16
MPLALANDAAPPAMFNNRPRDMRLDDAARRRELAVCPTDDDTIAPRRKNRDKQSFDYIWRSGLAGGLAGSAVGFFWSGYVRASANCVAGKDGCCAP